MSYLDEDLVFPQGREAGVVVEREEGLERQQDVALCVAGGNLYSMLFQSV